MSVVLTAVNKVISLTAGGTSITISPQTSTVTLVQSPTVIHQYEDFEIPDGEADGDILRWDAATSSWLAKQEPIEFKGIVLTPQTTPLDNIEGLLWYKSTDKSVNVCTDDE